MQDDERWKELCAQAAVEKDPVKLSKLVNEICRLLDRRNEQLQSKRLGNRQQDQHKNENP